MKKCTSLSQSVTFNALILQTKCFLENNKLILKTTKLLTTLPTNKILSDYAALNRTIAINGNL